MGAWPGNDVRRAQKEKSLKATGWASQPFALRPLVLATVLCWHSGSAHLHLDHKSLYANPSRDGLLELHVGSVEQSLASTDTNNSHATSTHKSESTSLAPKGLLHLPAVLPVLALAVGAKRREGE